MTGATNPRQHGQYQRLVRRYRLNTPIEATLYTSPARRRFLRRETVEPVPVTIDEISLLGAHMVLDAITALSRGDAAVLSFRAVETPVRVRHVVTDETSTELGVAFIESSRTIDGLEDLIADLRAGPDDLEDRWNRAP